MIDEAAGRVAPRPALERGSLEIRNIEDLNQRHSLLRYPLLVYRLPGALMRCEVEHTYTAAGTRPGMMSRMRDVMPRCPSSRSYKSRMRGSSSSYSICMPPSLTDLSMV